MSENKDDIDLDGWDLFRAAEEGRVDIVRLLIEHGADVNARVKDGGWYSDVVAKEFDLPREQRRWEPPSMCIYPAPRSITNFLSEELVTFFTDATDASARSKIGSKPSLPWTPLQYASIRNSLDVARLLIEHGANTDGIDLSWMDDQADA